MNKDILKDRKSIFLSYSLLKLVEKGLIHINRANNLFALAWVIPAGIDNLDASWTPDIVLKYIEIIEETLKTLGIRVGKRRRRKRTGGSTDKAPLS